MSPWKRFTTMAAAAMFVGLTMQTSLSAQEPTLPKDGKALATQLGISGSEASKMMPQLDRLASALTRHDQMRRQMQSIRTELHDALTKVAPTLGPEQRQQLMGLVWGGNRPGAGMRGGMGQGMGSGMHQGMGSGMHQGMGPGMHQGMGPGMHQGMGPGMHQGMGPGAGSANCPYNNIPAKGADSTGTGSAPQRR